jgi:hypothetical protein
MRELLGALTGSLLCSILLPAQDMPAPKDAAYTNLINQSTEITARLRSLDLTNNLPPALRKIRSEIFAIPELDRQNADWKAARRIKTVLWLKLLDRLDSLGIRNFDFSDPVTVHVAPSDRRYDSGVDPSVISDPVVRKEYEDAIRKNYAKAVRYNYQFALKILDEQFSTETIDYVTRTYKKTSEDVAELTGCLDSSLSSKLRKDEIKKQLKSVLAGEPVGG